MTGLPHASTVAAQEAQAPETEARQPAPATTPGSDPAPGFEGQVSVGYVLVPVVVHGPSGFQDQFDARDFVLRVDGRRIAFDSFESGASAPIGVLFLQDLSGSMGLGGKLDQSRTLVECVLRRSRPGDEFAVATFSDRRLFVDVPFPGPESSIREAITAWDGFGRTALHDAVAWLPDLVHSRTSPRRAVILVTDGVDNASVLLANEARREVRQAEVPVHVIGLDTGSAFEITREGDKVHRLADMLNLIGWATGGGYHPVESETQIVRACGEIVESLRYQYILGFPTSGEGKVGRRKIEVSLAGRKKKFEVRYRHSYEGTAPTRMRRPTRESAEGGSKP